MSNINRITPKPTSATKQPERSKEATFDNRKVVASSPRVSILMKDGFSRNKCGIIFRAQSIYPVDITKISSAEQESIDRSKTVLADIHQTLTYLPVIKYVGNSKNNRSFTISCKIYSRLTTKIVSIKSQNLTQHLEEDKLSMIDYSNIMKRCILNKLCEEKLFVLPNLEDLLRTVPKNQESNNYQLWKSIVALAEGRTKFIDNKYFPFKKIISLADGKNPLAGTAKKIRDALNSEGLTSVEITSADLPINSRMQVKIGFYGSKLTITTVKNFQSLYNIKIAYLDNTESFSGQKANDKYDLIIMDRGLCLCNSYVSCGGIEVLKAEKIYEMLTNVASILDKESPEALALLGGVSGYDLESLWADPITIFNDKNHGQLVAEIVKNRAGLCKGITIRTYGVQTRL